MTHPVIEVRDLVKHYTLYASKGLQREEVLVRAVDGISFDLLQGETLGLVGESGCGKSTAARTVIRLIEPTAGSVVYEGTDLISLSSRQMRKFRTDIQIVFQDPYASLNPRMPVREIVGEGLRVWGRTDNFDDRVGELLNLVGLNPAFASRYAHEFSGGQRQRIGIARALAVEPNVLILDEPVSALDVSVQAQILNLLSDLQQELGLAMLFIAHDLSVVRHISTRVAVMYLGRIVEIANREELYKRSQHPYTQALLSAVPIPNPKLERERDRIQLEGEPPSPIQPPSGCSFRTRCSKAQEICAEERPILESVSAYHEVACHFPEVTAPIPA
ncbi:MAG: ABC transporter ATP-binding protein [Acidimicrobiales bacterium]